MFLNHPIDDDLINGLGELPQIPPLWAILGTFSVLGYSMEASWI